MVQRQCFERRYEWLSSSDRVVPRGQSARSGSHRTFSSLSCRGGRSLSLSNRTSLAKRSRVVETRRTDGLRFYRPGSLSKLPVGPFCVLLSAELPPAPGLSGQALFYTCSIHRRENPREFSLSGLCPSPSPHWLVEAAREAARSKNEQ